MTDNGTPGEKIVRLDERSKDHERRLLDMEGCVSDIKKAVMEVKGSQARTEEMISDAKRVVGWLLAPAAGLVGVGMVILAVAAFLYMKDFHP